MNFHDLARPRNLQGRPMYCSPLGQPIAALPDLCIWPEADGTVRIGVWLLIGKSCAKEYSVILPGAKSIERLIVDYLNSPERCLYTIFAYSSAWADRTPKDLDLADIGL